MSTGPGRPTKLDDDRAKRIVDALAIGATIRQACDAAGIDAATYHRWIERGNSGDPDDDAYRDFRDAATRARTQAELRMVGVVQAAAASGKDWRAAAWYLERRRPDEWGRRDTVDLNHYAPRAEVEQGVQRLLDAARAVLPGEAYAALLDALDDDAPDPDA